MNDNEKLMIKQKIKQEGMNIHPIHDERAEICPECKSPMRYIYGEMFECPNCGRKEPSDFGKVKEFLDVNGPQTALVISDETGVTVEKIEQFLHEGRVEIPDGSDIYIRCQSCGTDIRYGRYCPDCMIKLTKDLGKAMMNPEVGEKPTNKSKYSGKMHLTNFDEDERGRKRSKK